MDLCHFSYLFGNHLDLSAFQSKLMHDAALFDNSNINKRSVSVFCIFCCSTFMLLVWSNCSLSYGHKRARNKRIGPRGGTERLHHYLPIRSYGVEIG